MPATNSASEKSFTALRKTKKYLRSTMKQERSDSLTTLHAHKERTYGLSCQQQMYLSVEMKQGCSNLANSKKNDL